MKKEYLDPYTQFLDHFKAAQRTKEQTVDGTETLSHRVLG